MFSDLMLDSFQEVHQQHIVTNRAYSRGSSRCKYDLVELVQNGELAFEGRADVVQLLLFA